MKTTMTTNERRLNHEAAHRLKGPVPTADSLYDFDSRHEQAASAPHARRRSLGGGRSGGAPGPVNGYPGPSDTLCLSDVARHGQEAS
ncbi:MAG: hypothetical protein IH945_03560 [Armatimonadetes bacterium]|nr:hypothetical protein [Armatimonadota bacterium]